MTIVLILLSVLAAFFAVVLIRTARFRPKAEPDASLPPLAEAPDAALAAEHLAEMIRIRTVSFADKAQEDPEPFEEFPRLLARLYPNVHSACKCERPGPRSLLFRWPGKAPGDPTVLMAHYDVVPADEDAWEKPPFAGIIEGGVLWGRGTLDTKGTLLGVMEAAEAMIARGFVPEHDIYLAFAGDEEIAGTGAPTTVKLLKARGIHAALVVDEGGAVVENVFPGVSRPCALVGIGEKGSVNFEFSLASKGGHASAPPAHTLVGRLARAVTRVEGKPFPARMTKATAELFDTLGRHSTFVYRMIFANLWCFLPLLDLICKKRGGELNALMRTTCAFTMMEGSRAANVLPPKARMVANLRLISGDTASSAAEALRAVIQDDSIAVQRLNGDDPSPFSRTDSEGWRRLRRAIRATWPEALVSPYLMIAGSDSRHFSAISENVMRFCPMALSTEERGYIHGHNERIPVEKLGTLVEFYLRLIAQC